MSANKDVLLKIEGLRIEGYADEEWIEIVHGVDLTLHRGEVMGLIGESCAGKSTIGLASMGYARDGCRISGGSIEFDGMELTTTPESDLRALRGSRIAYVAQSAAAWADDGEALWEGGATLNTGRAVGGGFLQPGPQDHRSAHRSADPLPHQEADRGAGRRHGAL